MSSKRKPPQRPNMGVSEEGESPPEASYAMESWNVELWQWMRQPSVQSFGAQSLITKITPELFHGFEMANFGIETNTFAKVKSLGATHICLVERFTYKKDPGDGYCGIGSPGDLRPFHHLRYYALQVDSFDSEEARQWGSLDDDEVYGYKIGGSGDIYDLWQKAAKAEEMGRTFMFGSEPCAAVVSVEDGYAVALFDGPWQAGFLGRRGAVEAKPPWLYVSKRIAERIARGCLVDFCRSSR